MLHPIVWKEWREQRWKLAFGTVMLLFFTGSFLAARVTSDRELVIIFWVFGGLLLALYSSMGVFAPEQESGTLPFLVAKPVSPILVFFCKWLFGWLNMVVPILVCTLVLILVGGEGTVENRLHISSGLIGSIGLATIFYTMTACFAPRKASEAYVGFVGLLIFLAYIIHMIIVMRTIIDPAARANQFPGFFGQLFAFINPFFWMFFISEESKHFSRLILFVVQLIVLAFTMYLGLLKWKRSV